MNVLQRLYSDGLEKPASAMEHLLERKAEEFWNHQGRNTLDLTERNISQNYTQFIGTTWRIIGNTPLQGYAMLQGVFSRT